MGRLDSHPTNDRATTTGNPDAPFSPLPESRPLRVATPTGSGGASQVRVVAF